MQWLLVVLIATAFTGVGSVLHRFIARDEHVVSYAFLFTLLSGLFYIPLVLVEPLVLPSTAGEWFLFFAAACLWWTLNVFGITAVKLTEETLGRPLRNTKIFFILLLSAFFLGEAVGMYEIVGSLLVFAGVVIVTWEKGMLKGLRHLGVRLTLASAVVTSFVIFLDKFNVFTTGVSPAFYGMMMYLLPAMVLGVMTSFRIPQMKKTIRSKWKWIILVSFVYAVAYYLYLVAYQMADLSVVFPISQLAILVTMVLAYIWLGERKSFRQRVVGAIVMIAGAILVALGT